MWTKQKQNFGLRSEAGLWSSTRQQVYDEYQAYKILRINWT
jgi:hypothetical protein